MSLNYYAEVNSDGLVLAIYGGDGEAPSTPHTMHPLQGWAGMSPSPSPRHVMEWNGGAIRWMDPTTPDQQWAEVRAQRDALLSKTDWRVTRAAETGVSVPAEWLAYRQALRDMTQQSDPFNVTWPTPPTA